MTLETLPPALGIGAVLVALVALLGTLGWWQRRRSPHPESVRKVAHVGMGLVTLGFPWVFHAVWPVWVLCAASVAVMAAARWWRPLRPSLGGVMGRVERAGGGEFYFTLAVAALFTATWHAPLTHGVNLLYTIPVLILALADAVGALVGVNYGRARYTAGNGHKSVEGSLAFFLVAFFSTHVPLLLGGQVGRAECLLIGLLLGLLVMLLEAVCGHGTDNLLVPLASFVALRIYLHLGAGALLTRFVVLAGLTVFMLAWRRRTYLDDSAPLAAALVLYLSGSLGGWPWLLGPAALLLGYTLLCPRGWHEGWTRPTHHNADAVACVAGAGFGWLFAAWGTRCGQPLLFPYTLTFAAHLGMIALAFLRGGQRRAAGARVVVEASTMGVGLVLAPYLVLCVRPFTTAAWDLLLGATVVTLATAWFGQAQPGMNDCPADPPRWWRQGGIAALASLGGLAGGA